MSEIIGWKEHTVKTFNAGRVRVEIRREEGKAAAGFGPDTYGYELLAAKTADHLDAEYGFGSAADAEREGRKAARRGGF